MCDLSCCLNDMSDFFNTTVTPYRISWTIFTLDLVINYTDKLLVFRWVQLCSSLADLFYFATKEIFMTSLSDDNQAEIIEAFN